MIYQLRLRIDRPITVTVGKLGRFTFAPGHYVYTGSAQRNMDARIRRHLKKVKPLRWHIDYLTVHPDVQIERVERFNGEECRKNQTTPGTIPVPGFGSSDCTAGCGSHLKCLDG